MRSLETNRTGCRNSRECGAGNGFTLVEVLLALALLGIACAGLAAMFMGGFLALDVRAEQAQIQSVLRSKMENLVGTSFDSLAGGSNVVTVGHSTYTMTWAVAPMDIDGDADTEANAKLVTLSMAGKTLRMILVDHEGNLRKL